MQLRVPKDDVSITHDTYYTYIDVPDGACTLPAQPAQSLRDIDSSVLIDALVKYHRQDFRDYIEYVVSVDCEPQISIDI